MVDTMDYGDMAMLGNMTFGNLTLDELLAMENNVTFSSSPATPQRPHCPPGPTNAQLGFYVALAWWLEGVVQIGLGLFGFIANSVAIPILLSKEMSSIFNRLLTCMAVLDNVFIVCSVLEALRKHVVKSQFQEYLFGYFMYQFHNMVLCACIYVTVVLALERYRAVWRPVEYHNNVNGINPWRRVASYIVPVIVFSIAFNLPKFFEVRFVYKTSERVVVNEDTGQQITQNVSTPILAPTALKLSDHYVLWYSNVARLVVTGLLPFAALTYLNSRIYTVIRRRRRLTNRPRGAPSAAQKAEEGRQAIVLLVIVILFLICHTLRIILNIHGLFSLSVVRESLRRGCSGITEYWSLIGASISQFLLTINSSVNFIIYCFMSTTFRRILYRWLRRIFFCVKCPEVSTQPNEESTALAAGNNVVVTHVNCNNSIEGNSPGEKSHLIPMTSFAQQQQQQQQPGTRNESLVHCNGKTSGKRAKVQFGNQDEEILVTLNEGEEDNEEIFVEKADIVSAEDGDVKTTKFCETDL